MEDLFKPDCIRTFTGLYMNVFEPTADMICIEDIAHSLSQQPRFGGHLPRWYSVAQHSVMCQVLANEPHKFAALLHDAAEAYLLDMPKPIKDRLPEYKKLEDNLMKVIARKFGFEYPLNEHVKWVDTQMLKIEWHNVMLDGTETKLTSWNHERAEYEFLKTFKYYAHQTRK